MEQRLSDRLSAAKGSDTRAREQAQASFEKQITFPYCENPNLAGGFLPLQRHLIEQILAHPGDLRRQRRRTLQRHLLEQ